MNDLPKPFTRRGAYVFKGTVKVCADFTVSARGYTSGAHTTVLAFTSPTRVGEFPADISSGDIGGQLEHIGWRHGELFENLDHTLARVANAGLWINAAARNEVIELFSALGAPSDTEGR